MSIASILSLLIVPLDTSLGAQATLLSHGCSDLAESGSRSPLGRVTSDSNLTIQLINLFEGETLSLVDHEVDKSNTQEAAAEPNEEDLRLKVSVSWSPVDQVRS